MLSMIWELVKATFTRKAKEDKVPTCINGFDLNGWVEITEVQPNILWMYAQLDSKKEKAV